MNLIDNRPVPRARAATIPDLSPRFESRLEWWFVQGFIESPSLGRREFMVSAFRQGTGKKGIGERGGADSGSDGHLLLVTSLDPATGQHIPECRASPKLVDNFVTEACSELDGLGIDPTIVDATIREVAKHGPPRPVITDPEPVQLTSAPFSFGWGEFCLRQNGDAIELTFDLPDGGPTCHLTGISQAAWFEGRDIGDEATGRMAYDSCPRLDLTGVADGEPITGQAWIDHQWGGLGWLRTDAADKALLGWDWLGINLEDGRDLIVMVRRDMLDRDAVWVSAILFEPGQPPRDVGEVAITGTRIWTNPNTLVDYPVECRITIPALNADLSYAPMVDDQEVPVFGLMADAIWEGVGRVNGQIAGRPVTGRARLELNGYGNITDFKHYQKKWIDQIDNTLKQFLPETFRQAELADYLGPARWAYDDAAQTAMLAEPTWDLLSRGGKHWRPIFGLLLLDALGVDAQPHEMMFSAIPELVHNGSVIIDDIEDASLTRRGEATIHRRYSLPTAINAGNTLYFLPLLTIASNEALTPVQRDAIYQVITQMFVQAHFGQAQDLYWSQLDSEKMATVIEDDATGPVVLQAHAFKSAAAVRAIAEIACIIAGADDTTRNACCRLAESWGVAFQIVDDVNNFTTAPEWGKTRGEDVVQGKVSYATHKAVTLSEGQNRDRLMAILTTPELRQSEPGLAEAIELIEASGALDACKEEAIALVREDWPAFSCVLPSSRAKIMLRVFMEKLLGTPFEM
jgi:geranylgeranyl diphosphate synthase type I